MCRVPPACPQPALACALTPAPILPNLQAFSALGDNLSDKQLQDILVRRPCTAASAAFSQPC